MKIRFSGRISDAEPRLPARINRGSLILGSRGRESITVDSGFTGSIAIPEEWANRLDLQYAGIQRFELANRQIVEFSTYLGPVRFGRITRLFEFIVTGEALLGMEFFEKIGATITFDCKSGHVLVEGELAVA